MDILESFSTIGSASELYVRGVELVSGSIVASGGPFGGTYLDASELSYSDLPFKKYSLISFWVRNANSALDYYVGDPHYLLSLNDGGSTDSTTHMALTITRGGRLFLELRSRTEVKGASRNTALMAAEWSHIEAAVFHDANGYINVYVNGSLVLEASNLNLRAGLTPTATKVSFGETEIADIVIQTSDVAMPSLLGEHRIHTLLPNADTATSDWVGSYTDIDNPINAGSTGDTDYIKSGTLNAKSEFGFSAMVETPDVIYAVQPVTESRKDAGDNITIVPYLVSNAVREDDLPYEPLLSAALNYSHSTGVIFTTDQDTGSAWTEVAINAIIGGVEITIST